MKYFDVCKDIGDVIGDLVWKFFRKVEIVKESVVESIEECGKVKNEVK